MAKISTVSNAVSRAVDNVSKSFGQETDKEINTYNRLNKEDFKALSNKYGEEEVNRYIKVMEARRMGVK